MRKLIGLSGVLLLVAALGLGAAVVAQDTTPEATDEGVQATQQALVEQGGEATPDITSVPDADATDDADANIDATQEALVEQGGEATPDVTSVPDADATEAHGRNGGRGQGGGRGREMPNMPLLGGVYLGVSVSDTPGNGAVIESVEPDSPAAEAGLQVDDIIVAIDGTTVRSALDVVEFVRARQPGDAITITVERDGQSQDEQIEVTLGTFGSFPEMGEMPDNRMSPGGRFGFGGMMPPGRLGVAFVTLDETVAAERETDLTEGALITEVQPDSPAAEAGVAVDDIVTAVNGEPVDQERTLRDRMVAYEPGDVVTLTVVRDGDEQTIDVTVGDVTMADFGLQPFFFDDQGNLIPFSDLPFEFAPTPEVEQTAPTM